MTKKRNKKHLHRNLNDVKLYRNKKNISSNKNIPTNGANKYVTSKKNDIRHQEQVKSESSKIETDKSLEETKVISSFQDLKVSEPIKKHEKPISNKKTSKKKKEKVKRPIALKIINGLLIFVLLIYVIGGAAGLYIADKMISNAPELNVKDVVSIDSTTIYDANGNLITEIGAFYRENITYDQCPESLVDAFLSIEDSRFFQHNGFDIPRFSSSIINTLLRGNMQGGSTFTMQLVKNTYFSIDSIDGGKERDATIAYKVQQIYLALKLEKELSKQDIFAYYVNKLNFGGRIRGVQKASEYYFNKSVSELNISESALLAGIVNLPNKYNPYVYLDYATNRRNEVLYQMLNHGYIDEAEYNLAKSIKVEDLLAGEDKFITDDTQYSQYIDVVIQEAVKLTGKDPAATGMKIYTALEPSIQQRIEDIENGVVDVNFADDLMQTAIISMNNQNGEVVGIGGGRNYQGGSLLLNRATQQFKQPGSSIKPIVDYALAFEYLGYSLDEVLEDRPITFPAESRVLVNADGKYAGDVTITEALQKSLNIPAILTLENVTAKIGSNAIVDYMNTIGFSKVNYDDFHASYAIGGNSFTTTVEELAGAHAAMINLGIYNEPHTIRKAVIYDGTAYEPENQNVRVLSSGSAYLIDTLMNRNTNGDVLNFMDVLQKNRSYPVYAKTGTTDWGSDGLQYGIPKGAMKDKWMVSSTSQYTNAVWVGYDKAIAGEGCYFPRWKSLLNIPGNINNSLLDVQEELSPDTIQGVKQPDDVTEVTYISGTYPHVSTDVKDSKAITSQVSLTGLTNVSTVSKDIYSSTPVLSYFDASLSNGIMYINWNTQKTCNGSKDISLKDEYNNISMRGACLGPSSYTFKNSNPTYYADIYVDDKYVGEIKSKNSFYTGIPIYMRGDVKVCGYYKNSKGTSNKACTYAGNFNPEEGVNLSK